MKEDIFRTPDGRLVLKGIKEVGIDHAVSFDDAYGWPSNGFPEGTPPKLVGETFWAGLLWEKRKRAP